MPFPNSAFSLRARKGFLMGAAALLSAAFMLHCNSASGTGPANTVDSLSFVAPAAGAQIKFNDTNYIIFQTDTSKYPEHNLYVSFSLDSGKCWAPACLAGGAFPPFKLKGDKGEVRLDTLKWVPSDYPFVAAGKSIQFKATNYPPIIITRTTGMFTIN
jgi:hypothetical protein